MIDTEEAAQNFCANICDVGGMDRLSKLADLLVEENKKQNLIAPATIPFIWQRHFADSLQLLEHVPRGTGVWLDIGSGAGFPGLAVAAAVSSFKLVLSEPRKLRSEWLRHASEVLNLKNVEVAGCRIELLEELHADVISARAVAPLTKLLHLSARFSNAGTIWLLPKGRNAAKELAEQPSNIRAMFHVKQSRTDADAGILVGKGRMR